MRSAAVLFFALQLGCERAPSQRPSGEAQTSVAKTAAAATVRPPSSPLPVVTTDYRRPAAARVVAVGDLHGDFEATKEVLRLAGALGAGNDWIGGELVLVQTGDQLDRGEGELEIVQLLENLEEQASRSGGAVLVLNGNHEVMNALGDFRYVTPEALHEFDGLSPVSPHVDQVMGPYHDRAGVFLPGGAMALRLARRLSIVQVGDTLFVHGGLKPDHVRFGIDRFNAGVREFLLDHAPPPDLMLDSEGPLWTRIYGGGELGAEACAVLAETLRIAGARRMVIGHTIQESGISSACGARVFRIDVGMSAHYGSHDVQALELRGTEERILSAPRAKVR